MKPQPQENQQQTLVTKLNEIPKKKNINKQLHPGPSQPLRLQCFWPRGRSWVSLGLIDQGRARNVHVWGGLFGVYLFVFNVCPQNSSSSPVLTIYCAYIVLFFWFCFSKTYLDIWNIFFRNVCCIICSFTVIRPFGRSHALTTTPTKVYSKRMGAMDLHLYVQQT